MTARQRVFARMWGVAVLAHLAGNWFYGDIAPQPTLVGVALALAGILATAVMVAPRPWLLMSLGLVVPVSVVLESPVLGNHWLLAGFVSLAYLVTGGRWDRFEPVARTILLVFYGFAAFAKLNTGFLDPATSCGLFYANQAAGAVGLGPFSPDGPVGWGSAWGSALVELSVPILLLFRRTRAIGVLLAVLFHGLVSLDPAQHFYDFTAVLLPLFVLFLDDEFSERFETAGESLRPWVQSALRLVVVGLGVAITLASVTALSPESFWFLAKFSFAWWIPYLAFVTWTVIRSMNVTALNWRVGPVGVVLIALVAANGLTPYLEIKTATAWNMYANLVTVDGESNHLLIRSTVPLRDGQSDLVSIISSPDPGLQIYADTGHLLPWPSFLIYLADHPETTVVYERAGTRSVVAAGEVEAVPAWWRFLPLRAIHGTAPDQCQVGYLPAL